MAKDLTLRLRCVSYFVHSSPVYIFNIPSSAFLFFHPYPAPGVSASRIADNEEGGEDGKQKRKKETKSKRKAATAASRLRQREFWLP